MRAPNNEALFLKVDSPMNISLQLPSKKEVLNEELDAYEQWFLNQLLFFGMKFLAVLHGDSQEAIVIIFKNTITHKNMLIKYLPQTTNETFLGAGIVEMKECLENDTDSQNIPFQVAYDSMSMVETEGIQRDTPKDRDTSMQLIKAIETSIGELRARLIQMNCFGMKYLQQKL